ncbi:MAG: UDP-N-acetylmuramate:L-alanyl-gamma-D-glutamyl-meso-diaminopimelate ligase [Gammaproteobacteria bacterium RIFCSPHIGHO2_12_FULL_41_20]|nr:MAG: UDP-N-acetylmuramate:L-alanyl-gamma-D-glutamyl-meso-diaminopimelate ligase [Gammaproteobacteria bacterium RIFCSPHIGHO2_12_FULL_41_20]
MKIHILGIGGTFMSGVALLAKEQGHDVTGSDMHLYPPMSTQLAEQGVTVLEGYSPEHIDPTIDCVVVGNVIKRGNPAMEHVLATGMPYISGPQWLAEQVLRERWVLAVAGTHGKTTTTSLLTWILDYTGKQPGFLIGGIPENFGVSSRLGQSPYFVIEADEYDSAFFDKRSKFIHYHPRTVILNNLEYDHADIFPDLYAIQQQFHYLIRTIPSDGLIIQPAADNNLAAVIAMGCWTPQRSFGGAQGYLQAVLHRQDGSCFEVVCAGKSVGIVEWELLGQHNVHNALAALVAAEHVGINVTEALPALRQFKNVKRRLEIKGQENGIIIYDDFAHHPTAIATTLQGLRAKVGQQARLVVVLEFGSYTMRTGVHKQQLPAALASADYVVCKRPEQDWGVAELLQQLARATALYDNTDQLVIGLVQELKPGDHVVIMSNSGFDGVYQKLLNQLKVKHHEKIT